MSVGVKSCQLLLLDPKTALPLPVLRGTWLAKVQLLTKRQLVIIQFQ